MPNIFAEESSLHHQFRLVIQDRRDGKVNTEPYRLRSDEAMVALTPSANQRMVSKGKSAVQYERDVATCDHRAKVCDQKVCTKLCQYQHRQDVKRQRTTRGQQVAH